jgi:hypothetical protein
MRWYPLWFVGMCLLAGTAHGAELFESITLTPPRAAAPREAIWLKVTAGSLPRGSILRVTTEDGRPIGAITPFGATPGQTVQDYTLPLPKSVTDAAVIRLRIQMQQPNSTSRAPTPGELLGTSLIYVPIGD